MGVRISFSMYLLALAIPVSSVADTFYKCEGNGVMVFSDTPCRGKQIGSEFMENILNYCRQHQLPQFQSSA